ncbi:unnamed protein product [Tilletia laevis]|uniref:Dihydroorotate dehydrogenase (quinone), mitochondrial n=1 Tax=Tilletia laevis TaxID=157183 RepID=A0A9N8LCT6_9BASI|nr:unnamed protein product [Tilletia laevis]
MAYRIGARAAASATKSVAAAAAATTPCTSAARLHTTALARSSLLKDAAKTAAAHQAKQKGNQAIEAAQATADKLASVPVPPIPSPTIPPVGGATPTATSFWGGGKGGGRGGASRAARPFKTAFTATLFLVGGTVLFAYYRDSRAGIHRWIAIPVLKSVLDPEAAQKLAIDLLVSGIAPVDVVQDDEVLRTELFGMTLSNPLGLAAGFDKQAQAIDGLFNLGFGIVEVGSVTPEPQPGNPTPRYFRLPADDAAINRFGFNSDGHGAVLARLRSRLDRWILATDALAPTAAEFAPHTAEQLPDIVAQDAEAALLRAGEAHPQAPASPTSRLSLRPEQLLSINLGKNKTTPEHLAVRDYILGIHALGPFADMLVVNISSPNTPGLRDLQRAEVLESLLSELVQARDQMVKEQQELASNVSSSSSPSTSSSKQNPSSDKPEQATSFRIPLLLKIAPDLSESELDDIAKAAKNAKIDGLIVSNTTIQRPRSLLTSPDDPVLSESGGLSGRPLKPLSLRALRHLSRSLEGAEIPLIGCGGIFSGADALEFARAGASAVQIYTSFGYTGVGAPRRIKDELVALLKEEGKSWMDVVGSDARASASS